MDCTELEEENRRCPMLRCIDSEGSMAWEYIAPGHLVGCPGETLMP